MRSRPRAIRLLPFLMTASMIATSLPLLASAQEPSASAPAASTKPGPEPVNGEVVPVGDDEFVRPEASGGELSPHSASSSGANSNVPVYYPRGEAASEDNRFFGTDRVIIQATEAPVAGENGLRSVSAVPGMDGWYVGTIEDAWKAPEVAAGLRDDSGIVDAFPDLARYQSKRTVPTDPLFGDEWHLKNTGQNGATPGIDVRAEGAWDAGFTGAGILVSIVDDGLEHTHEDLSDNYDATLSYDRCANDADPAPGADDWHGTAVAGVTGAVAENGIGVAGAAYDATLSAQRLISCASSDSMEAAALNLGATVNVSTNSWGPADSGTTLGAPGPLTRAAIAQATQTGRSGLGTVFTWAVGNGRLASDDGNYDGYANSRYVIAVGGVNDNGEQPDYAESCACTLVAAPTDDFGHQGITTTDVSSDGYNPTGNYTNSFGGTSSATPLVAGVVALVLEAEPDLTWRDVQGVLAESANAAPLVGGDWTINSAGFSSSREFGFGLVDASAAVELAQTWTSFGPELMATASFSPGTPLPIPDDDDDGVTVNLPVTGAIEIERVELNFSVPDHTWRGDIAVYLTSPSGTVSTLIPGRGYDSANGYDNWSMTSTQFYGELAAGTWTLTVVDEMTFDVGNLTNARINVYGHTPRPPALFDLGATFGCVTTANAGDLISCSIDVANFGEEQATGVVRLLKDGVGIDSRHLTLAAGATETVEFEFTPTLAGVFAMEITTAADNYAWTLTVTGMPDLVIEDVFIHPEQPVAGDMITYFGLVRNDGTAPADGPFAAIVENAFTDTVEPTAFQEAGTQHFTIMPGGIGWIFFGHPWHPPEGTTSVTLTVDTGEVIAEGNEENNALTVPLTVLPADPGSDSDFDLVDFSDDICPGVWDPEQRDNDTNGVGDACQLTGTSSFGGDFGVPAVPPPAEFDNEVLILAVGLHRSEEHVGSWNAETGAYSVTSLPPGDYILVGFDKERYVILPGFGEVHDAIGFAQENDCSIVRVLPDALKTLNFNLTDPFKFLGCAFDSDGDGIDDNDELPGCAFDPNPDCVGWVSDYDFDGIGDMDDNCPGNFNPDQLDADGDGEGDACETDLDGDGLAWWDDVDDDGDGVVDEIDNCPAAANADQANADTDSIGDACELVGSASFTGTFDTPPFAAHVSRTTVERITAEELVIGVYEPARRDVRIGTWNAADESYSITDIPGGNYILFAFNSSAGEDPLSVPDNERGFGAEEDCGVIRVEPGSAHNVDFAMGDRFLDDACPAGAIPDTDYDGALEPFEDNCPGVYNPDQADSDGNGVGDACPSGDTDVTLHVMDEEGNSISGVTVEVYGDWAYNDVFQYRTDVSDGEGMAMALDLAAGHFIARACQPGLGCGEQAFLSDGETNIVLLPLDGVYSEAEEVVHLELSDSGGGYRPPTRYCGGTLKGTLKVGDDPVPNANINVWQHYDGTYTDLSPLNGWGYAETDANGNFTITNLGNASFDMWIDGWSIGLPGLNVQQAFFVDSSADITRCGTDAQPASINATAFPDGGYLGASGGREQFRLNEGLTISGTVFGPDGPLEGMQVNAWNRYVSGATYESSWARAETDEAGSFTLRGLIPIDDEDDATGFEIQVTPGFDEDAPDVSSFMLDYQEDPIAGDDDMGSPNNPGSADEDHIDPRLDIVLRAGASLRGNVTDSEGNPLQYAWVSTWSTNWSNPSWGGGSTGPDGEYRIGGLLAGEEYDVNVWPPWGANLGTGRALLEIQDGINWVDFTLSRGIELSGCVVDDGGDPVPYAWLSVASTSGLTGGWGNTAGPDDWSGHAEGCFEILGLQAGTYTVYIYPPWNPAAQLIQRQVTVTLDPDSPGYDDEILDANEAGDTFVLHDAELDNIVLSSGGKIVGCLVDGNGDPVVGAWVNAWSGTAFTGMGAQSAAAGNPDGLDEGCFRITGLAAANDYFFNVWPPFGSDLREFNLQDVTVTPPGETLVVDGVDDPGTPGVDVKIELNAGHSIVGDVVDEDGNPLAFVGICAWREDHGAFGWAMTDASGHFEVRGLALPGDADDKEGWFLWIGAPSGYIPRNYPMDPYRAEWDASYAPSPFDVDAADNEDTTQVDPADDPTGQSITDRGLVFGTDARLVITLSTDDTKTYVDTNWDTNGDGTVNIDDDIYDSDADGQRGSADAANEDNEYGDADGEQPIVLGTGRTLPGFVLDEAGVGIPDAGVWVWGSAGWGYDTTDASGEWSISGLSDAGTLDVWVSIPDGRYKYETGGGILDQGCQLGVTGDDRALGTDGDSESAAGCVIQFEAPGAIRVKVNAGDDDSGVYVQVYGPGWASGHTGDNDQATDTETSDIISNADSTTGDVFGEIFFDQLAPGQWTVRFYRADCYVLFESEVVVTSGETTIVEVSLQSAGTLIDLEGNVLAEGGTDPLANALVIANLAVGEDVTTYTTSTDANGRYLFNDIPLGDYKVVAIVDSTHQATREVVLDDTDDDPVDGADADGVFDSDADGSANALPDMVIAEVS